MKGAQGGFTTHGTYDMVARCKSFLRQRVAEATAHPCDEYGFSAVHGDFQ
ncbi:Unknown protein sequence [Pseudomonas syringae pv. aceris]|nr:Unknown protein sequence [Pseudomonas syringae pv. aceris]